jgi:predicted nuclease of predicted toxin-antitoxin system
MAKVKLMLDEDVHLELASALRKRGYDAIHVQELARKGLSDRKQIEYAVEQESCIFTFNVKDFVLLHNEYVVNEKEHFGIIVASQLPIGEALRRLLALLQRSSEESMKNMLEFL